jgi:hypothetical protein
MAGKPSAGPGEGDDIVVGKKSADLIHGYGGNDTISGGDGNDRLFGDGGNDRLNGDAGNDDLRGGDGNDTLYGGAGNDALNGGAGADIMSGGTGADHFDYTAFSDSAGSTIDRITDYSAAEDDLVFAALDANPTAPGLQQWTYVEQVTAPTDENGQATLTFDPTSNTTTLNLYNNDGNATADFTVVFNGHYGEGGVQVHVVDLLGHEPIDGIIYPATTAAGELRAISGASNLGALTGAIAAAGLASEPPSAATIPRGVEPMVADDRTGTIARHLAVSPDAAIEESRLTLHEAFGPAHDGSMRRGDSTLHNLITDHVAPFDTVSQSGARFGALPEGTQAPLDDALASATPFTAAGIAVPSAMQLASNAINQASLAQSELVSEVLADALGDRETRDVDSLVASLTHDASLAPSHSAPSALGGLSDGFHVQSASVAPQHLDFGHLMVMHMDTIPQT